MDESFATYTLALEKCVNQREIQLISVYELGIISLSSKAIISKHKFSP